MLLACMLSTPLQAADPFAAGVRTTGPLTAAEEQKTFKLPPGFEIQLVAAEPDIYKPLNMAFDARGRLWVTDTVEHPFPAPPSRQGRDTLKILEDTDVDVAFRTTTLTLVNGKVVSGLFRRAAGATLVFVDDKGKEFTVSKSDIEEQKKSHLSLMPANLVETIPERDFQNLLAYLLSQRAASEKCACYAEA